MTHRSITRDQQISFLVVKVFDAVVDHDVGVPDLVGGHVHCGDVLVVGGHPLEPGVLPPHHEPDMRVQSTALSVNMHMERHHVDTKCYSPL